jgi:putative endonuclease
MIYRQAIGKKGEEIAQAYLKQQGYKILHTNLKISYKELDIVAEKKHKLIFVEVKTRASNTFGTAQEALGFFKTKKLKMAISLYLHRYSTNYRDFQLDFIAIDLDGQAKVLKIKHFEDVA